MTSAPQVRHYARPPQLLSPGYISSTVPEERNAGARGNGFSEPGRTPFRAHMYSFSHKNRRMPRTEGSVRPELRQDSRFLMLPLELRDQIYSYLTPPIEEYPYSIPFPGGPGIVSHVSVAPRPPPLSVFLVCRQVYTEIKAFFYRIAVFTLSTGWPSVGTALHPWECVMEASKIQACFQNMQKARLLVGLWTFSTWKAALPRDFKLLDKLTENLREITLYWKPLVSYPSTPEDTAEFLELLGRWRGKVRLVADTSDLHDRRKARLLKKAIEQING